ncbi:hypothetical protein PC123_g7279 [Phytophthora cactorum]|nr:hypothetical protein PC123_g7279 [Phytophthora cactorum]
MVLTAPDSIGHLVASITKHRKLKGQTEYFVRWQDSTIDPSWEPLSNLSQVTGLILDISTLKLKLALPRFYGRNCDDDALPAHTKAI